MEEVSLFIKKKKNLIHLQIKTVSFWTAQDNGKKSLRKHF